MIVFCTFQRVVLHVRAFTERMGCDAQIYICFAELACTYVSTTFRARVFFDLNGCSIQTISTCFRTNPSGPSSDYRLARPRTSTAKISKAFEISSSICSIVPYAVLPSDVNSARVHLPITETTADRQRILAVPLIAFVML